MNRNLLNTANPLARLRDDVSSLFDRMVLDLPGLQVNWGTGSAFPAVNLWEDQDNLYAEAELPGVNMENIEVSVVGNELSLKGTRKDEGKDGSTYHRRERGTGSFSRVFHLPLDIDNDRVGATLRNGVLLITMPKAAAARPRKVEVKATSK